MRTHVFVGPLLILFVLGSFVLLGPLESRQVGHSQVASPRWILHSPLDGRPEMVVLALDSGVFVAYDASTCGYDMAWTGGISFSGQTAADVPLPVRRGEPCSVGVEESPWEVRLHDLVLPIRVLYRGCSFEEGQVSLEFEIQLEGGGIVSIKERPEVLGPAEMGELWAIMTMGLESKWPDRLSSLRVLRRRFVVSDLPKDLELRLRFARTISTTTAWPGFTAERAPQGPLDESRHESLFLTFQDLSEAYIYELIAVE